MKNVNGISVTGKGMMLVKVREYPVTITAKSVDGLFPQLIEVKGDHEMMQFAIQQSRLQLEAVDLKFWVEVAGYRKDLKAVLANAEPFFRALACSAAKKRAA
jgi:hypothetical protein